MVQAHSRSKTTQGTQLALPLPVNVDALLHKRTIESERVEFKKGWNPLAVMHTLCAFANDFHNLGGGYIVLGVEERQGRPVLPAAGVAPRELDAIQKELVELGNRIVPPYHPVISPCQVGRKHVLVLWAPGGQTRPYKAPVALGKREREYAWFIRKGSTTVRARGADEHELLTLAATVPFDDRVNHHASLSNLSLRLIQQHLQDIGSELFAQSSKMPFPALCRRLNIVAGPDEDLRPLNAGLLLFNDTPDKFFPQSQIDVVHFPRGRGADAFTEKTFKGPLTRMVRDALGYINATFIHEVVVKQAGRAEARRFFTFPFAAVEEAVVNAVYHRDYQIREPVEVRVLPDRVEIVSYPGPDRSIRQADFKAGHMLARRYRNRRIGEFLKEQGLTEGRGTGVPKMLQACHANESPEPVFATDSDRTFFAVSIPIHPHAPGVQSGVQSGEESKVESGTESRPAVDFPTRVLRLIASSPLSKSELAHRLGKERRTRYLNDTMNRLLAEGLVEYTIPENPTADSNATA